MKRHSLSYSFRSLLVVTIALGSAFPIMARNFRPALLPNGAVVSCAACHLNGAGGGSRNAFGLEVEARLNPATLGSPQAFWNSALAALDSDGDGFTNGEELGDPDGDGKATPGAKVTNPGDPASNPINNKMPTARITAPANLAHFTTEDSISIEATAADTDGTVRRVEFYDGTTKLGESGTAPFTFSTPLGLGVHSLVARAIDDRNGSGKSTVASITVDLPPIVMSGLTHLATGEWEMAWTGGQGPFVLQRQSALGDLVWQNSPATVNRAGSAQLQSDSGFFRVFDVSQIPSIAFSTYLNSNLEHPAPSVGEGSGLGLLRLEGNLLFYEIRVSGLSGPVIAAHIHGPASPSEDASPMIAFDISGPGTNGVLSGFVTVTPEQTVALLNGQTYVNFHTRDNAGGEIRGQIAPVMMLAQLNGASQRPDPVETSAKGSASLMLVGNKLSFNVSYTGLSAPATAAHIHGPSDASNTAGVMIDLVDFKVGDLGTSGAFAGTVTLTIPQLVALVEGKTYINIHNVNHPSGEIRGQLLSHITAVPLTAVLSGLGERPTQITNNATGSAILLLEGNTLSFDTSYAALSGPASAGHIHGTASSSQSANVLIDLAPYAVGSLGITPNGAASGSVVLTAAQRTAIVTGKTYINFHTEANPKGEIRGQIVPSVMKLSLSGTNERPSQIVTPASGSGTLILAHDQLGMVITYRDLSGDGTAAHIHGPANVSQVANPPLLGLEGINGGSFGTQGALSGTVVVTPGIIGALVDGLSYINIHTPLHSAGEIRGQVVR